MKHFRTQAGGLSFGLDVGATATLNQVAGARPVQAVPRHHNLSNSPASPTIEANVLVLEDEVGMAVTVNCGDLLGATVRVRKISTAAATAIGLAAVGRLVVTVSPTRGA